MSYSLLLSQTHNKVSLVLADSSKTLIFDWLNSFPDRIYDRIFIWVFISKFQAISSFFFFNYQKFCIKDLGTFINMKIIWWFCKRKIGSILSYRSAIISSVSAFFSSGLGSILGRIRNFNSYLESGMGVHSAS